MLARAGAVVASILLVVAALWFRNRPEQGAIVCDPMIADACREAFGSDATVVEPSDTLDRAIAGETDPFVWITAQAWVAMADDPTVNRAGDRPGSVSAVASTEMIVASAGGSCLGWDCLVDALIAGEHVGLDRPSTSSGLTTAAYLVEAAYGPAADSSIKGSPLVRALEDSRVTVGTVRAPAASTMAAQPGKFTVAATTGVLWSRVTRAGFSGEPAGGDLVIVMAGFGGSSTPSASGLRSALVDAGWRSSSGPPPDPAISPGLLWSVAVNP